MKTLDDSHDLSGRAGRSSSRQVVALLVIGTATAQALGIALKSPTQLEANDISRWCTVWSLLERGTYAIDDCPWQAKTQDKVRKPDKLEAPSATTGSLARFEYAIAPRKWKEGEPTEHFYSSKPPLLPTIIAGMLYPVRKATAIPLDFERLEPRHERNVSKPDPEHPGQTINVLETPKEPIKWPAYVYYLKPVVVLFNIVPMLAFLILFARLLDRVAANDWAWMGSLFAAAFGTYLLSFDQTLNNHTVAAYSAFFALYPAMKIWDDPEGAGRGNYLASGFFGAFCACNELPAAVFGILLFLLLLFRSPKRTLAWFVPVAIVPCLAFLLTQFAAMGQFKPVYEEFGTKTYEYAGSYWATPLEFDYFNKEPEPKWLYLVHMTVGHHGVFSLSPIFAFSMIGALRALFSRSPGMVRAGGLTLLLTIAMLAFYDWNPKARNYGGSTQGLRWLFWLIPFWLVVLPAGLEPGEPGRGIAG